MSREISDDPSVVRPIFDELDRNFRDGKTRDVSFRRQALRQLLKGYQQLIGQFNEALKADLGLNSFMSNLGAHALTTSEIKDLEHGVKKWARPQSRPTNMGLGFADCAVQYQPLGVSLVLSAWNYPIYTAIPQVAAAISAGNCVILKPSELASHTSGVLKKLFDNYLDQRYYRVVEGKVEIAKAVTRLPLGIICFTGSTFTGRLVAIEAAKNLVPCILELGGKCPVIVDQTAKLDPAINRILTGKFLNCGQTCIGIDHVYVHESQKAAFRSKLLQKIEEFYGGGQNLQQEGNYGKIINDFHVGRIEKLLKDNHGGDVIYGGNVRRQARFIAPTVVENPNKNSLMMQEQIFGPIMPLFYYTDLNHVIEEILNRAKPLVVYHFSESSSNQKQVRYRTSSGAYVVNDSVIQMSNLSLPFGGVGGSGHGRFHGKDGFIGFSNPKSIAVVSSIQTNKERYPPYGPERQKALNGLLKLAQVKWRSLGKGAILVTLLIAAVVLYAVQPWATTQAQ